MRPHEPDARPHSRRPCAAARQELLEDRARRQGAPDRRRGRLFRHGAPGDAVGRTAHPPDRLGFRRPRSHRPAPQSDGSALHHRPLRAVAEPAPPQFAGLPTALGRRRVEGAVPRHDSDHRCALGAAQAYSREAGPRPSIRRLAPPEDRRHRRLAGVLRWHRHHQRAVGHARPSRRRSAPGGFARGPVQPLARRDDGDQRPRRQGA